MEYVYKIKRKTRKKPKPRSAAAPKAFRKIRGGPPPPTAAAPPAAAKFEDDLGTSEEWGPMYETAQSNANRLNQELKRAIEKMTKAEGITYLQQTVDAFVQEDPFLAEQVLKETLRITL